MPEKVELWGMLKTENARILQLIVHRPGQAFLEEAPFISTQSVPNEWIETNQDRLLRYFFKDLPKGMVYRFKSAEEEVATCASELLESPFQMSEVSQKLAKRLHECATHEKIRKGIFMVAALEGVEYNGEIVPAYGLYKAEFSEDFLQVVEKGDYLALKVAFGFPLKKLDKGCLIVPDANSADGFAAFVADRHAEIKYWLDSFLGLSLEMNETTATANTMQLVKRFSEDVLSVENNTPRENQLAFLEHSARFFEENEAFDVEVFKSEVIQDKDLAETFSEYAEAYAEEKPMPLMDSFRIAPEAVKKEHAKFVRSVIKLDKNFHLYVHGNKELLEQGFDSERNMKYYKIYYNQEQ
jgi:hypothetical protein